MIVLGIDPGSNRTGYGLLCEKRDKIKAIEYGSVNLGSIKTFPEKICKTKLRRCIEISDASIYGKPVFDISPESRGSEDYRKLTRELLKRM